MIVQANIRKIKLQVNSKSPHYYTVNSGIPQGSILNSTLFNIMTCSYDILIHLPSNIQVTLYADDIIWPTNEDPVTATNNVQTF